MKYRIASFLLEWPDSLGWKLCKHGKLSRFDKIRYWLIRRCGF